MNYANSIKEKIFGETTVTSPVRAAVYARVSTRNEGQKDSCNNQVKTASDFISDHKNIALLKTHVFVDNGISGKSVTNRPGYQNLMRSVEDRSIDLIIVKTCSRLFRSTLDAQLFLTKLLTYSVVLFTLEDNKVWDFESQNDVMMFAIRSVFDASTSKTQSDAGKGVQARRIRDKTLSAKDVVPGFRWDPVKKVIEKDPVCAENIVKIFKKYVYQNGTPASICQWLKDESITFPRGRRDPDTKDHYVENIYLSEKTISKIIINPKYIGKFYINQRSSKYIGGQDSLRYKLPEEEWVLCERPDLQIVDADLFEMAQRLRKTRINVYEKPDNKAVQARFQGIHKFAGKIFCPVCGIQYQFGYADRKKTVPIYRIKNHSDCSNPVHRIYEKDLEEITKEALKKTLDQQDEVCTSIERILTDIVENSHNNCDEIDRLRKQKATREKQLDNLIDQLSEGSLTEAAKKRIRDKINHISEESDRLSETIRDKESNQLNDSFVTDRMEKIRSAIADLRSFTNIDRDRILNYIDRIEMPSNGDINILLKTGKIITIKQTKDDFSDGKNVGKKVLQDMTVPSQPAMQTAPGTCWPDLRRWY